MKHNAPQNIINMEETIVTYLKPSKQPKLVILNGISGVGKSKLYQAAFKRAQFKDQFGFSISHTTRQPRPYEINGKDYHFVTEEQFQKLVDENYFIEHTQNHGNRYGTSFQAVQDVFVNQKKNCLLDLDYKGSVSLKNAKLTQPQMYVLIRPPSWDEYIDTLRKSGTESEEQIAIRVDTAKQQTDFFDNNRGFYDVEIVKNLLESAIEHFCGILEGFIIQ
uniref:Guanylate kinase n=1 Tax=Trepomonas sp. PC1 TaxID=1076344 RepID=A0A146KDZ1_9EUKA|eukprot:JAP93895.1 Guanylate kinase [Trepomonas sp. PC1]